MRQTLRISPAEQAQPLAALSDLKTDLGIMDTQQDRRLSGFLLAASAAVLAFINRPLLQAHWQDTLCLYQGRRSTSLMLGRYPVTNLMTMTVNGFAMDEQCLAEVSVVADGGLLFPPANGPE